jgi:hypothetical protein
MSARQEPGRVMGQNEEIWWAAVLRRDAGYTGQFVFGVRTTGIYCRPGCPARQPGRDRVVFFTESVEAEEAGFRACKRCHPKLFEEAREKQRLDEELKVAAAIQQQLRPAAAPALEGWELAGHSDSCRAVGGDYYDFIESQDRRRIAVAVGDVAGKGPGAALLMSSLHAAVRAQSQLGLPVNEVVEAVNRYLCENSPGDKFVTLFYAEVELDSGRIAVAVEEGGRDGAEALCVRLREQCTGFAGRAAMPDDRTIVAVRRKAEARAPERRVPILEMAQRER